MAVENDIVLIYMEEKPLAFARIEEILPDHKPDWYHVKLLLLQLPLQVVTWILRDVYINGEPYTIGGKSMRLELVKSPDNLEKANGSVEQSSDTGTKKQRKDEKEAAKVISLADLKKS